MTICYICQVQQHKYKCPACSIKYCSVDCFKKHKSASECEELVKKQQENAPKFVEDTKPERIDIFETTDTVPQERLEELRNSEPIKQLLKNPHLRSFLKEVNQARNAENAMKLAMKEPIFMEFADECLKIVEKDSNQNSNRPQ